jgi:hypothetical protein
LENRHDGVGRRPSPFRVFVYHEVHEDHEVFFNLILLRALRGDIFLWTKSVGGKAKKKFTPLIGERRALEIPAFLWHEAMLASVGLYSPSKKAEN